MMEWVWFSLLLPAHLYMSAIGQLSWVVSHFGDGGIVPETYVAVTGPRYTSSKLELPGTTVALWGYWGDEPTWGGCQPLTGPLDESEWALRVSTWQTTNLRGDETR